MTNEQIKEKYGIEPIMKEMWVWDDKTDAEKVLVLFNDKTYNRPYVCYNSDKEVCYYKNASERNPNDKEPKVGDKGYFWDDERYYAYDLLNNIIDTHGISSMRGFRSSFCGDFQHFSHEKQPWMK